MPAVVLKEKTEVRCLADGKASVMQCITSGEAGERGGAVTLATPAPGPGALPRSSSARMW